VPFHASRTKLVVIDVLIPEKKCKQSIKTTFLRAKRKKTNTVHIIFSALYNKAKVFSYSTGTAQHTNH